MDRSSSLKSGSSYQIYQESEKPIPSKKEKTNKFQAMSYRLQLKFLMQKTSKEANWDMDKDSEVRSHSDSEEDQEILKGYYKHQSMWKSIEKLTEQP